MKLRTQFIITMLLFGIILVAIAASVIITSKQVEKTSEQEKIASSIAQGASELSYLSNDYLIYRESQQLSRWQSRFTSFSKQVASLNVDTPEQQALVRNIQANTKRLGEVFDSVVTAGRNSPNTKNVTLDSAFLHVSWSRMAVQSQGLVSDALRLSQLLHQQRDQLRETRTQLMYVMVGLFGALLLASYMLTYRRILKSIATLQAGTAVIGSGDLDFKIEEKKNDEIGDLSHAFNRMTADLKAVTASKVDLEREIAERKRAEQALRESEQRLNRAQEIAHLGSWELDLVNNRLTWSDEVYRIFGLQPQEFGATYEAFLEAVHPDDQAAVDAAYSGSVREGRDTYEIEHRVVRKSTGEIRIVHERCEHIRDESGRIIRSFGMVHDITERKQTEEALRKAHDELEMRVLERTAELAKANEALHNLSSRLLSAQEEERKKIAGEIHDTLGSCLSGIKFKVESALQQVGEVGNVAAESLSTIIPVIQEGIEECRRMQMDLRPSILDDLGLLATLSWFCRRFETIYSTIQIEQEIGIAEDEIPNAFKIIIYRVIQEAMNNIAKHSKANHARLSLWKINKKLELVIQDNGQGFNIGKTSSRESTMRGLGLTSMKERTELSGGSFDMESTEGKGTIICAWWPLDEDG
jgi:PAS domain S-box-containing protein